MRVLRGVSWGLFVTGLAVVTVLRFTQPDVTPWGNYVGIALGVAGLLLTRRRP